MRCPLSMKAGRAGFGVSPPQIANDSPNPRLTGRGHIWLRSAEEQRQRLGVISWGWSPPRCCLDADRSPVDQHLPQACSPPHSTMFPRSVPGAPAATWRPPALLLLLTTPLHTPQSVLPRSVNLLSTTFQDASNSHPALPGHPLHCRQIPTPCVWSLATLQGTPFRPPGAQTPQQPALTLPLSPSCTYTHWEFPEHTWLLHLRAGAGPLPHVSWSAEPHFILQIPPWGDPRSVKLPGSSSLELSLPSPTLLH